MRSAAIVALLVSASALLAGCSDDGGHGDHAYTCPDGTQLDLEQFPDHDNETFNPLSKCPRTSGTTTTNSTPNQLPTLTLKVTDDGGNETPVTLLDGNLTFDAAGSSDPDGSVTGIAVSVTDSNTTRTATLFDAATKSFKTATFKFDRPGVVNVTVAMVDDRAGFTVNQTKVYVNHPQDLGTKSIPLPAGDGVADACTGDAPGIGNQEIVEALYTKPYGFTVVPGATLVEAFAEASGEVGSARLTICAPDGTAISDTGTDTVASNAPLPPPVGTDSYNVVAYLDTPSQPNAEVSVSVIVHYEPQDAGSAAQ